MLKTYDYRLVKPSSEKQNPGKFIVYKTVEEGDPLATCRTREAAELLVNALNKNA